MFEVYPGEKRYLAVDLADVLAAGDTLTGSPTTEIVAKRGRTATTMETNNPTPPLIDGTEVQFWIDVPDTQARGNYIILLECPTTNGEVVRENAPLIVL